MMDMPYRETKFYKDYNLVNLKKETLLKDMDLAIGLASFNMKFGEHKLAQDMDILRINGGSVAYELVWNADKNGWGKTPAANDPGVFGLRRGDVGKLLRILKTRSFSY